ncbi:MAG: HAD family hydrolase [Roseburia sp.]|nr:HAD family hydrolase [Roseburia sp.]
MIRAVIFDMFETLITHFQSPLYFGAELAQDAGIPEEEFLALWQPTESDRTVGALTLEETLEMILRKCDRYSDALLQKMVAKRIAAKEECFRHLHPEILPMLSELKKHGYLIGLISNCYSEEAPVIRQSALFPYFDAACLSYEQGVQKPEAEIFHRCTKMLGVRAKECLYVGDGGSYELETARRLGMTAAQAVWYLRENTSQPSGRKPEFAQLETPLAVISSALPYI